MGKKNKKSVKIEIVNFNDLTKLDKNTSVNNTKREDVPKVPLTEEESEEIRKKLTRLLIFVIVVGITALFVINYMGGTHKKKVKDDYVEPEEEIVQKIPEGKVNIDNSLIANYVNISKIHKYDFAFNSFLFQTMHNGITDMSKLHNSAKLYFASKSKTFNDFIKTSAINSHGAKCAGSDKVVLSAQVISDSMKEVFGPNVTYNDASFYYVVYDESLYGLENIKNVYSVSFENGTYIMNCISNYNVNNKVNVTAEIVSASNTNNVLSFENQMIFITKNGIYADSLGKKLLSKTVDISSAKYLSKGTVYKFIFNKVDDNYYLSAITK